MSIFHLCVYKHSNKWGVIIARLVRLSFDRNQTGVNETDAVYTVQFTESITGSPKTQLVTVKKVEQPSPGGAKADKELYVRLVYLPPPPNNYPRSSVVFFKIDVAEIVMYCSRFYYWAIVE